MGDVNKAIIFGHIGKKEFKPLTNGGNVCKLTVSTARHFKDGSGQKQKTITWHTVNFFNRLADIANNCTKIEDYVGIEGEIVNKKVIDSNGITRIYPSINASELHLVPLNKPKTNDFEANGNIIDKNFDKNLDETDIPY